MKNKFALAGGIFLALICLAGIFAPWLSPYSYHFQDMDQVLVPPSLHHWFGTDGLGRDLLSRILYGARVSLGVGLVSSFFSLVLGTAYGLASGYWGGIVDSILMRTVDIFQAIPPLVLMILISVVFSSLKIFEGSDLFRDVLGMILALILVGWVGVARMVRGQVLQVREFPFVEAARAAGANSIWIIVKHILPQISGSLIITFTYLVPAQILFESFLSFIGLGLQPPYSSWGVLASEGWRSFRTYPHLILFPGAAIFLTMLASQFFGDGLRDLGGPKKVTDI
jgi:oligopeptide transport system permease protein